MGEIDKLTWCRYKGLGESEKPVRGVEKAR